jgi:ATP-dependent RNA helicase RhlE
MNQGFVSLKDIQYLVLDEADRMLDMGFIHDIRKIIAKLPVKRQSLFFSATMAPEIVALSEKILGHPEKVTVTPEQTTAEKVAQTLYFVSKKDKPKLLIHLLKQESLDSTLVFTRTKHGADKIVRILGKAGIKANAIHGNKSQNARQKALGDFKSGSTQVMIATDIAARGIDIDDLATVVNYDIPNIPETYVHRIGRTGRASASGIAISFCDAEEKAYLKDIQKLIQQSIPTVNEHPYIDGCNDVPEPSEKPQNRSRNSARKPQGENKRNYNKPRNPRRPQKQA